MKTDLLDFAPLFANIGTGEFSPDSIVSIFFVVLAGLRFGIILFDVYDRIKNRKKVDTGELIKELSELKNELKQLKK